MGLGPGALADYVELFLSDDIYLGGCIWEWADHSVYHKDSGNYTYGGDHGEYVHDGCFCVDGLFRPDREPYTSAFLMKAAYRPIRARHLGDGKVEFYNVNRFRSSDYIEITTGLSVCGEEGESKALPLALAPTEKTVFTFDYPTDKDAFLNVKYVDKETGRQIAEEQVILNEVIPEVVRKEGKIAVEKKGRTLTAQFENGSKVTFDLSRATMTSYSVCGKELLIGEPKNRHKRSGRL